MFDTGFNFALIVLGFGLLIFVHEGGHFLAAKWAGIRTEAFAIGMGTAVVSWRKGIGFAWGSTHKAVVAKTGKSSRDLSLAELEQEHILRVLKNTNYKIHGKNGAADLLDINPSTLRGRMRKHGIQRPPYKT